MPTSKDEVAEAAVRYERRVSYVHNLLAFHPEYRVLLPTDELRTFDLYFRPDWVFADNFFRHYVRLREADPDVDGKMDAVFAKFLRFNRLPLPKWDDGSSAFLEQAAHKLV